LYGVAPRYSYFNGCSTAAAGADGGATLPTGLQRHRLGSAGNKLEQAPPATALGAMLMNAERQSHTLMQDGGRHSSRDCRLVTILMA